MTEYGALIERLWQERDKDLYTECHFVHHKVVPYILHFCRTAALCMWVYHTYRNTRVGIYAVLFGLIPKLDTTATVHRAEHRAVDTITGTAYTS